MSIRKFLLTITDDSHTWAADLKLALTQSGIHYSNADNVTIEEIPQTVVQAEPSEEWEYRRMWSDGVTGKLNSEEESNYLLRVFERSVKQGDVWAERRTKATATKPAGEWQRVGEL